MNRAWWDGRRGRCILALVGWTAVGLLDAGQSYLMYVQQGAEITWGRTVGLNLGVWYLWAVLAVIVFRLGLRFPVGAGHGLRHLPLHLATAVGLALVKQALDYPIIATLYCPLGWDLEFSRFYRMAFTSQFTKYFVIYWALLGLQHALRLRRQSHERSLRAAQLETQLANAQLRMLRLQLHPHFLFNTLNAISGLIHADVRQAERMIARLGDLLRVMLDGAGEQEVPLRRELEFVRAYLEIQQVRFGPRLDVRIEVEPGCEAALVPYLVLQPLVENAIAHGIALRRRGGRIAIRARRAGDRLQLEVIDDGPGPAEGGSGGHGIGLRNIRARLGQMYGPTATLTIGPGEHGGYRAVVDLPFQEVGTQAAVTAGAA